MKRIGLISFIFISSTLFSADFRNEFLNEVITIAKMNPAEIMEEEWKFLEGFKQISLQKQTGNDEEIRPVYISALADFERTMALFLQEGKIKKLFGINHAPTPATSLCTEGQITNTLVDKSIQVDPRRLFTIKKRSDIIRTFLEKGGTWVTAYPELGKIKRTKEELSIFERAKKDFPKNLIDKPLAVAMIEPECIGATYIFEVNSGEQFVLAIMAKQANAPEDNSTWAMWFGSLKDPIVNERFKLIFNTFLRNDKQLISLLP